MDSVKVSVIIPVMNQGDHICACLDSVMNQTLQEIEIIVVEGGSKDRSTEIICAHMDRDPRIRMLNKAGEGLPMARKAGVASATGKYVYHLDGDDILEPQALELLYNRAEETAADMVVLNFWIQNDYNKTKKRSNSIRFIRFSGIDFIRSLYLRQNYWMVWSVLHKRSLYENRDIRFEAHLSLGEDALLTTQLAYCSKKVVKLDSEPLLHHYVRKDPETKRLSLSQKNHFDLHTYPELIRKFLREKPEYETLEESINCLRLQTIARSFQYRCFDCACERSREALHILRLHPSLACITGPRMKRVFHAYSLSEKLGKLVSKLLL
ncbi:MAG: glycosyltransferase family 2 protein [Bacteroidales bacterium]